MAENLQLNDGDILQGLMTTHDSKVADTFDGNADFNQQQLLSQQAEQISQQNWKQYVHFSNELKEMHESLQYDESAMRGVDKEKANTMRLEIMKHLNGDRPIYEVLSDPEVLNTVDGFINHVNSSKGYHAHAEKIRELATTNPDFYNESTLEMANQMDNMSTEQLRSGKDENGEPLNFVPVPVEVYDAKGLVADAVAIAKEEWAKVEGNGDLMWTTKYIETNSTIFDNYMNTFFDGRSKKYPALRNKDMIIKEYAEAVGKDYDEVRGDEAFELEAREDFIKRMHTLIPGSVVSVENVKGVSGRGGTTTTISRGQRGNNQKAAYRNKMIDKATNAKAAVDLGADEDWVKGQLGMEDGDEIYAFNYSELNWVKSKKAGRFYTVIKSDGSVEYHHLDYQPSGENNQTGEKMEPILNSTTKMTRAELIEHENNTGSATAASDATTTTRTKGGTKGKIFKKEERSSRTPTKYVVINKGDATKGDATKGDATKGKLIKKGSDEHNALKNTESYQEVQDGLKVEVHYQENANGTWEMVVTAPEINEMTADSFEGDWTGGTSENSTGNVKGNVTDGYGAYRWLDNSSHPGEQWIGKWKDGELWEGTKRSSDGTVLEVVTDGISQRADGKYPVTSGVTDETVSDKKQEDAQTKPDDSDYSETDAKLNDLGLTKEGDAYKFTFKDSFFSGSRRKAKKISLWWKENKEELESKGWKFKSSIDEGIGTFTITKTAPKTDAPKTDAPKTDAKTDAPKTDLQGWDDSKYEVAIIGEKTYVVPDEGDKFEVEEVPYRLDEYDELEWEEYGNDGARAKGDVDNGLGVYENKEGRLMIGRWKDGKLIDGKIVTKFGTTFYKDRKEVGQIANPNYKDTSFNDLPKGDINDLMNA